MSLRKLLFGTLALDFLLLFHQGKSKDSLISKIENKPKQMSRLMNVQKILFFCSFVHKKLLSPVNKQIDILF
ncbi:hypothetical protein HLVA_12480 [Haliovirga abyssi]|uniref:Uncharacterized protein n=1 Tax=Haliovirga abyssi TaxID=2996794 RepID=A0AAU9DTZ2_9FUSO|nr:hypothetical protein HLVA_12480 [Haliovirga abyssi]